MRIVQYDRAANERNAVSALQVRVFSALYAAYIVFAVCCALKMGNMSSACAMCYVDVHVTPFDRSPITSSRTLTSNVSQNIR